MHSSQNEQDNRRYAVAAAVPMLSRPTSQEAYDFLRAAIEISERWKIPVLLRATTRVCHVYTLVRARPERDTPSASLVRFERPRDGSRPCPLRARRSAPEAFGNFGLERGLLPHRVVRAAIPWHHHSGISFMHAAKPGRRQRAQTRLLRIHCPFAPSPDLPQASNIGVVIEEGDPYLVEAIRRGHPRQRQGGNVSLRRIGRQPGAAHPSADTSPNRAAAGKPPQLCDACPYRIVFEALRRQELASWRDIGCYTLGSLKPFEAMTRASAWERSLGVGLGLRHVLPPDQACRVVSIIGDSTFHS